MHTYSHSHEVGADRTGAITPADLLRDPSGLQVPMLPKLPVAGSITPEPPESEAARPWPTLAPSLSTPALQPSIFDPFAGEPAAASLMPEVASAVIPLTPMLPPAASHAAAQPAHWFPEYHPSYEAARTGSAPSSPAPLHSQQSASLGQAERPHTLERMLWMIVVPAISGCGIGYLVSRIIQ